MATAAGLVLAAVVVLLLVRVGDGPDCRSSRFDPTAWRAARVAGPSGVEHLRSAATEIARCGLFDGEPVAELREQLGAPTTRLPTAWSYSLAADPGTGLAWLDFTLDDSRRVVEASTHTM